MANEILGNIVCDGCGGNAGVKKLGNSPLLYLHCKKCGCDRRSGAQLQQKWRAAIDAGADLIAGNSASEPEKIQDVPPGSLGEKNWAPRIENKNPENSESELEKSEISTKGVIVGGIGILSMLALVFKTIRG
jgi:hypothetical protein